MLFCLPQLLLLLRSVCEAVYTRGKVYWLDKSQLLTRKPGTRLISQQDTTFRKLTFRASEKGARMRNIYSSDPLPDRLELEALCVIRRMTILSFGKNWQLRTKIQLNGILGNEGRRRRRKTKLRWSRGIFQYPFPLTKYFTSCRAWASKKMVLVVHKGSMSIKSIGDGGDWWI